jgi:two-component system sensor histidine kinase YesM
VKMKQRAYQLMLTPFSWLNGGVQRKLMLTCMIVITIPLALTAIMMYQGAIAVVKEQTEKYNYKMLQLMNEKIDKLVTEIDRISYFVYLDDIQTMLNQIPSDPVALATWQGSLKLKLNSWIGFLGFNGGIRGVALIGDNGVYFNPESTYIKSGPLITEADWYQEAMKSNGIKIMLGPNEINAHMAITSYREGSLNFAIARKVHNLLNNEPLGVLVIVIEMYEMDRVLAELNIDNSTKLMVIDRYNDIIYKSGIDDFDSISSKLLSKWNASADPSLEYNDDNTILINTFKSSTTNWSYITLTDVQALTSNAKKMNGFIIIIGLFGYVLAILLSYVLSKRMVIPMKRLQVSMKNIERNEFRTEISVENTDEIGQLTVTFNHMVSRIRELINSVYKANIKEKEAQISALQAQINPHFLYNTLDTVNAMAMVEDNEEISRMIVALGEMFKYVTNQTDKIVTIKEEMEHLDNYITIQNYRFGDRIRITSDISEDIQQHNIIRLTLQPLVENAIQHGLEPIAEGGSIRLFAIKEPNAIRINIQDDGKGIPLDKLRAIQSRLLYNIQDIEEDNGKGIGLLNVNERLKLYFGEEFGLYINSEYGKGTILSIVIPVSPHS